MFLPEAFKFQVLDVAGAAAPGGIVMIHGSIMFAYALEEAPVREALLEGVTLVRRKHLFDYFVGPSDFVVLFLRVADCGALVDGGDLG